MHWLTWRQMWNFLRTWQGAAVTALAVFGGIYYGPHKVLETYDWYLDRFFDSKVRRVLDSKCQVGMTMHGYRKWDKPVAMAEIVQATRMSESRVKACLRRLVHRKQAERVGDGDEWKTPDASA